MIFQLGTKENSYVYLLSHSYHLKSVLENTEMVILLHEKII